MGRVYPRLRTAPTATPQRWSEKDHALVMSMRAEGASIKAVAAALGIRPARVAHHLRSCNGTESSSGYIQRNCLCCEASFTTDSRFIRLCGPCRRMG